MNIWLIPTLIAYPHRSIKTDPYKFLKKSIKKLQINKNLYKVYGAYDTHCTFNRPKNKKDSTAILQGFFFFPFKGVFCHMVWEFMAEGVVCAESIKPI